MQEQSNEQRSADAYPMDAPIEDWPPHTALNVPSRASKCSAPYGRGNPNAHTKPMRGSTMTVYRLLYLRSL